MIEPLAKTSALSTAPLTRGLFTRPRLYLFAGLPIVALLYAGGATWVRLPGSDPRLVTDEFRALETRLDRRLYAPTAMPSGLHLKADDGPTKGRHRVMQSYSTQSADLGVILAQEPRDPERDAYHRRIFVARSERKVDLDGKRGYFVTGQTGERRLFWEEEDASIILSSANLPDEALVTIALSVQQGPNH